MHIEVTLDKGTKVIKHASSDYAEASAQDIWEALNRIEDLHADVERLRTRYLPALCWLRESLDIAQSPSMSVGDEIRWFSDAGVLVRHVTCEPIGWKDHDVRLSA